MKKWLIILPVLGAFGLIAYWADSGAMPAWLKIFYNFPNGDRVGHVVIYAIIALAFNLALPNDGWRLARVTLPIGSLIAFGMSVAEETSQFFFPSRTPDWVDLACGWLGIALATLPFIWKRKPEVFDHQKSGTFDP